MDYGVASSLLDLCHSRMRVRACVYIVVCACKCCAVTLWLQWEGDLTWSVAPFAVFLTNLDVSILSIES